MPTVGEEELRAPQSRRSRSTCVLRASRVKLQVYVLVTKFVERRLAPGRREEETDISKLYFDEVRCEGL
jgi:hypothetical protein